MPVLESPVDLTDFPITHDFWIDETNNSKYHGFYDVFDGHHPGVDFGLPSGTPVNAALDGIVVRREVHPGMGNVLATRLGNIYVLSAHLREFCVDLGQIVKSGQLLAYSDNTGSATTTPHLHFELRDLCETELIKMVFKPEFGRSISRYREEFTYRINNSNQPKNLNNLALRYFGDTKYASFLRDRNPVFRDLALDSPLPHDQPLTIPNY